MKRNPRDFWSGLVYVAFGVLAVVVGRDYEMGTLLRMGPAYFPTVVGSLLALVGLLSLARASLKSGAPVDRLALRGLAIVTLAPIVFGLIVRGAGLAVALPAMVLLSGAATTRFRWPSFLALAAGLTLFCVFVFLEGLGVPLPLLGSWFGR
jgi:hypothetical protein